MEHDSIEQRLTDERNVWLATSRDGHPPHLVPIWFVWLDERFWICTSQSVKSRNIADHAEVTVALEDGNAPVVAEVPLEGLHLSAPGAAAAPRTEHRHGSGSAGPSTVAPSGGSDR